MLNLHTHSEYSYRDGIGKVEDIAQWHLDHGMQSFAITDHGVCTAFPEAFKVAEKLGMKFIPGIEFYLKPEDKHDAKWWREPAAEAEKILKRKKVDPEELEKAQRITAMRKRMNPQKYHHITVIACNQTGMENLISLMNTAELYYKPRITKENLFRYSDGLIVLSGCIAGEPIYYIRNGALEHAESVMQEFADHFPGRFFTELQFHGLTVFKDQEEYNYPSEKETYDQLIAISQKLGIPTVITNDAHYITPDQHELRSLYVRIKFNRKEDDEVQSDELVCGYHLLTADEARAIMPFGEDVIESSIANTELIENMVADDITFPRAEPLADRSEELRERLKAGWEKRRKGTSREQESWDRWNYEFEVVKEKRFCGYFINVLKIIDRAAKLNIATGVGRGSAGGSEMLYLLEISNTDPLEYDLFFERFINPSRNDFPDVDLDFASFYPGMHDELYNRYGERSIYQDVLKDQ